MKAKAKAKEKKGSVLRRPAGSSLRAALLGVQESASEDGCAEEGERAKLVGTWIPLDSGYSGVAKLELAEGDEIAFGWKGDRSSHGFGRATVLLAGEDQFGVAVNVNKTQATKKERRRRW